jgi:hypothetical protein
MVKGRMAVVVSVVVITARYEVMRNGSFLNSVAF